MKFKITGKNLEVSDSLRDAVTDKLGKLDKYFSPDTRVIVTLSLEKGRQKVEVTIPVKGSIIRSEQISSDMYVSIDLAEEVLERQIRKYKSKIVSRNQSAGDLGRAFLEEESDEEGTIRIVRTKRFDIKPMYAEDACIQMDLLGHSFFVFNNAETDEVNVVYKRKDGSFGLIEPEN
ncbi:MAG: ribosome-associated translation inhibitor RaiA [Lachnospiraceae bacterium]|nr:ribosome-associated translation inhibitor RaiA [Lachnospiraceae bacterium]MBQ6545685.1 ribosome-associated translation inhibitor RaiA [Lachnospiraceae bacterium]